jgi:hypothetical protein
VALSSEGNTLAVGAASEDNSATGINGNQNLGSAIDSGAVYLFTRDVTTWSQQAYIKASNTNNTDAFGTSVALSSDGSTLAVGANGEDSAATGIDGEQFIIDTATNAGAVYLFTRNVTTWSQQAYIKASNTNLSDAFGTSVVLSGDGNTLAVGAHREDSNAVAMNGDELDNSFTDSGAVYLYTRVTGVWSTRSYAKAPNTDALDNFGEVIAMSGDGNTLVVGATGEDSNALGINGDWTNNDLGNAGAAYLY